MKIVGYQIFLRIIRFVILVIRPDYREFCLRSTPGFIGIANRALYLLEKLNVYFIGIANGVLYWNS